MCLCPRVGVLRRIVVANRYSKIAQGAMDGGLASFTVGHTLKASLASLLRRIDNMDSVDAKAAITGPIVRKVCNGQVLVVGGNSHRANRR